MKAFGIQSIEMTFPFSDNYQLKRERENLLKPGYKLNLKYDSEGTSLESVVVSLPFILVMTPVPAQDHNSGQQSLI